MKPIDVTNIYKKYKGLWVGLKKMDARAVVAAGKNVQEVMDKSKKKGFREPILFKVPTKSIPYVGSLRS
ncbi:hypothetical protein HY086_05755 [Candidatus Gottesmanbacteria bacterium]|nr:hypothetical protein [Candidatus Gottesmanbacteria bacterium]